MLYSCRRTDVFEYATQPSRPASRAHLAGRGNMEHLIDLGLVK